MTTIHLRKPVLLFGVLAASLATLAADTSAQSRQTPERPLSDAMAAVLRSPFHGDHAPSGSPGHVLLPGPAGAAASPAEQPPGVRIPAPAGAPAAEDETPSRGQVFLLTTLASAAGLAGTYYVLYRCTTTDPALVNSAAATGGDPLCATENETVLGVVGALATVTMTGGAATLAGRSFWRSLAGSALGYVGGLAVGTGLAQACCDEFGRESAWNAALVGGLVLGHAAITTLLFN